MYTGHMNLHQDIETGPSTRARDLAACAVVVASEHFGVFLIEAQQGECVARVLAGEDAHAVVGSIPMRELGIGS